MHVRRADFASSAHFLLLTADYYVAAARSVTVPGTHLVVFSDDPAWCKAELASRLEAIAPVTVVEGNADWLDLLLMARCNRHVVSNSTYAWWGAFLSGDSEPTHPGRVHQDPAYPPPSIYPASWRMIDP